MAIIEPETTMRVHHDSICLRTQRRQQFIDLTVWLNERVRRSGVRNGQVCVHTRHTTTAVAINENEPLLLEDFADFLERTASTETDYRHDDFAQRTVHLTEGERANGHAHLQALTLGTSQTLSVIEGRVALGTWQSVFLVEMDGPRPREVLATVIGVS